MLHLLFEYNWKKETKSLCRKFSFCCLSFCSPSVRSDIYCTINFLLVRYNSQIFLCTIIFWLIVLTAENSTKSHQKKKPKRTVTVISSKLNEKKKRSYIQISLKWSTRKKKEEKNFKNRLLSQSLILLKKKNVVFLILLWSIYHICLQ